MIALSLKTLEYTYLSEKKIALILLLFARDIIIYITVRIRANINLYVCSKL